MFQETADLPCLSHKDHQAPKGVHWRIDKVAAMLLCKEGTILYTAMSFIDWAKSIVFPSVPLVLGSPVPYVILAQLYSFRTKSKHRCMLREQVYDDLLRQRFNRRNFAFWSGFFLRINSELLVSEFINHG